MVIAYRTYEYKLYDPPREISRLILKFGGDRRCVYNAGLSCQRDRLAANSRLLSEKELYGWLDTDLMSDPKRAFLKEAPPQILRNALKDLSLALDGHRRGQKGFPKFREKSRGDSFRYWQGIELDEPNGRVCLPRLGWLRYRKSRDIEGKPLSVTVSVKADGYHISIQTVFRKEIPAADPTDIVGLDMGVRNFATASDGTVIKKPSNYIKQHKKLSRLQNDVSRKIEAARKSQKQSENGENASGQPRHRDSNRLHKAKMKVARQYKRIADARRDFSHKASTCVSREHAFVACEDLRIQNMTKSVKGTIEKPGENVAAKRGLNRSVLNQGWGMFFAHLEYKLVQRGGKLIRVSPYLTSQRCPKCKLAHKDNRKTRAEFKCVACGYENDADIVGALNVLTAAGQVVTNAR